MTVAAPTSGIVLGPARGPLHPAGAELGENDVVMELLPLPADNELLAAREEIAVREADLDVARARAERATQLLAGRSGSQEQLEQAKADLVRAESALRLARSQQSLLLGDDATSLTPITLVSQQPGVLAALHVASGQLVAAGAPLFTVEAQDRLWVRVPVYASDSQAIDPATNASVASLGNEFSAASRDARPIVGPPSANPTLRRSTFSSSSITRTAPSARASACR